MIRRRGQGHQRWPQKSEDGTAFEDPDWSKAPVRWVVVSNIVYFHPYLGGRFPLTRQDERKWSDDLGPKSFKPLGTKGVNNLGGGNDQMTFLEFLPRNWGKMPILRSRFSIGWIQVPPTSNLYNLFICMKGTRLFHSFTKSTVNHCLGRTQQMTMMFI